jgi:hypothetical protein
MDARYKIAEAMMRGVGQPMAAFPDQRQDDDMALRGMASDLYQADNRRAQDYRAGIKEAILQSWPAELAKSAYGAVTLPGDVYAGKVNPMSDEAVGRAAEFAGLMTLGAGGIPAGKNEMRMGIKAYKGAHPTIGGDVTDWKGRVLETRPEKRLMHDVPFESPGNPYAGFFSDDPAVASSFARALSKDGGAVFPVDINLKNPKVIDAEGRFAADFQFGPGKREAFLKYFDDHDGVILKNTKDEGTVIVPRRGAEIKSVFEAGVTPDNDLISILRKYGVATAAALPAAALAELGMSREEAKRSF